MNLEFNIAIHVMCFLVKHSEERWSSKALADSVCIHPVQIRRVTAKLIELGYIEGHRGKQGGYQANQQTAHVPLTALYDVFIPQHMTDYRVLTGGIENTCLISRQIGTTMHAFYETERERAKTVYEGQTIQMILEKLLKESK
ncbi:redox-sensitive transcriptional regulator HypR [Staphylococcus ratti]|uniref:Rrf2 family transcriptional regulator n=1 Tax=Staphylococcus ratti TaxID=2892440 RepID=A0ABY3PD42_9STAP|nr:redox-sensitive transcriptional regulator HypR [Staphylococcus ratti]UEX90249.1 Rrf2 family transcriptional regulator [Staphylococcus ratti]